MSKVAALLTVSVLLASCGRVPSTELPHTDHAFTTVVDVPADASQADVERRTGGQVVVWRPDSGFAVVGLSRRPAGSLGALGVSSGDEVEDNNGALTAGGSTSAWNPNGVDGAGRARIWSGGRARIWSGGRARIWSGGNGTVGGLVENQAAWQQIGLSQAWNLAPTLGEGVKVAVIDTGLDLQHQIFEGALAPASETWDFVDNDADPQETGDFNDGAYGHGTNVAGIVLQLAPRATIMPLRVLNPDGSGSITDVAQAINWAVDHGAQVINLSLGSVKKTGVIKHMIEYASGRGVIVVASSGNTGDHQITYPARYSQEKGSLGELLLSVGSVNHADQKSDFSTYGKELELVAPGEEVYGPVPGNLMSYWSGTSMAAPMVSGALALGLAQDASGKAALRVQSLQQNAVNIDALNSKDYAKQLGRRLDVGAFIKAAVQK
ncbi:S8 family serine peptidase [Deinococcus depolymerans]